MKLTVIGGPGSGKSTLAKKISEVQKIPYLQIDRLWFESGGNSLNKSDEQGKEKVRSFIKEQVLEFIKQDAWVSDGWYPRVQSMIAKDADQIIFLDIPLYKRILNHLKRTFKNERHKELTRKDDLFFVFEIIRREFRKMPKMRKFVGENKDKVQVFRNYKQIDNYINNLFHNIK